MLYRQMGKWGLKLSELSLGSWITFGSSFGLTEAKDLIKAAFDEGINFFDTAEVYANGAAELILGESIKQFARSDVVISTKLFWGGKGPNDQGLSRKHLVEGTRNSLRRLQLEYIDILFCHRPDPKTPLEETAYAMDYLVRSGLVLYWGTSEWSAEQIASISRICLDLGLILPSVEQPQYNLFHRKQVEQEYSALYDKLGIGTTTWSPLDSGVLTGKYKEGIPEGSRLYKNSWLRGNLLPEKLKVVERLHPIADKLGCSMAQLSIAWCLKNPHVSSVLLGVSSLDQLVHNLRSIEIKDKLTQPIMDEIHKAIDMKSPLFEFHTS